MEKTEFKIVKYSPEYNSPYGAQNLTQLAEIVDKVEEDGWLFVSPISQVTLLFRCTKE